MHAKILVNYEFTDVSHDFANFCLRWSDKLIKIPIQTDTKNQTLENIPEMTARIQENWISFFAAAQYHFYDLGEPEKALPLIEKAIALEAPNPCYMDAKI